jgi:hypothetical protein
VPSMGGGTKRSGTLRSEADAVGTGDSDGKPVSLGDGEGNSCATAAEVAQTQIKNARLANRVMSSGVETSLDISLQAIRLDSFVSRLSRRFPRGATVHVARPTRSIPRLRSE